MTEQFDTEWGIGIQRPILNKHDTPNSPHREHMKGAKQQQGSGGRGTASTAGPPSPLKGVSREQASQEIWDKYGGGDEASPFAQFDFDAVSDAGLAALKDPGDAGFFEGEDGVGMLEVNSEEIGEMTEEAAGQMADTLGVSFRAPGRAGGGQPEDGGGLTPGQRETLRGLPGRG